MSDMTGTARTPEENRTWYNRRLREKRSKGHDLKMITEYAAQCPVPLDQLDLTSEERPEVEKLRPAAEKRRHEQEQEKAMRELAARIGKGELVEPEAVDFEAVKDIPGDEAYKTKLAKLNLIMRLVDAGCGYLLGGYDDDKRAKKRAIAKAEANPAKHYLEYIEQSIQEIRAEDAEWKRRHQERCEALAKLQSEMKKEHGYQIMATDYQQLIAILNKHGVSKVTAEFSTDNFGYRDDPRYDLHDVSVSVHGEDGEDIDDKDLTLEELALFDGSGTERRW
jgi:hypothetical protein